jgi:hypothetical protein
MPSRAVDPTPLTQLRSDFTSFSCGGPAFRSASATFRRRPNFAPATNWAGVIKSDSGAFSNYCLARASFAASTSCRGVIVEDSFD